MTVVRIIAVPFRVLRQKKYDKMFHYVYNWYLLGIKIYLSDTIKQDSGTY